MCGLSASIPSRLCRNRDIVGGGMCVWSAASRESRKPDLVDPWVFLVRPEGCGTSWIAVGRPKIRLKRHVCVCVCVCVRLLKIPKQCDIPYLLYCALGLPSSVGCCRERIGRKFFVLVFLISKDPTTETMCFSGRSRKAKVKHPWGRCLCLS